MEWDDPYGGECSDVFVLSDGGRSLTQLSDMTIRGSGQRCQYRYGRMVLSLLLIDGVFCHATRRLCYFLPMDWQHNWRYCLGLLGVDQWRLCACSDGGGAVVVQDCVQARQVSCLGQAG